MRKKLQNIIEQSFGITQMFQKKRRQVFLISRSLFFYILKQEGITIYSMSQIYGYNHSTVINAIKRFQTFHKYYPEYKSQIDYVISEWAAVKSGMEK